jgi:hypothetical protein
MYSITMLLLMLLLSWQLLLLMPLLLQSWNAMLRCIAVPCCLQLWTSKALLLRLPSLSTFHVCQLTPCLSRSLSPSFSCTCSCRHRCSKASLVSCCCPTAATFCCILHRRICLSLSLVTCEAATCPAGTPC